MEIEELERLYRLISARVTIRDHDNLSHWELTATRDALHELLKLRGWKDPEETRS